MIAVSEGAERLEFTAVTEAGLANWHRPRRFEWTDRLGTVPIADSELLNVSHHCPIAIQIVAGGPRVVCVLRRNALRSSPVAKDGRWLPAYSPLALRAMPFRLAASTCSIMVEIAPELASEGPAVDAFPFEDDAGRPQAEYALVLSLLDKLARGIPRLNDAAKLLIASDILVPLTLPSATRERPLLTVSASRLAQLPGYRAAALTADGCIGFDLAAACLFSQRLLASDLMQDTRPPADAAAAAAPAPPIGSMLDQGLADAMETPFELDESALFSFEEFATGANRSHE